MPPRTVIPISSAHNATIERLRRSIPVSTYLTLLNAAAVSGHMPILAPDGRPTGEFSVVLTKDRILIAQALLDKAMPDRAEAPALPEDAQGGGKTIDVRTLSDTELDQLIAAGDARPVEGIVNDNPESSPDREAPPASLAGEAAP